MLHARPSEPALRESARGLLVACVPFLLVGGSTLVLALWVWLDQPGSPWRRAVFGLRLLRTLGLLGGLIGGYGLVCLLRALRMRREAARLSRGRLRGVE